MKCFYHKSDLDGWCSAAIVKYRYPECELIGMDYGDKFPWEKIESGEKVYMVDFSLQPYDPLMLDLDCMCRLVWIDHHESAIENYRKHLFVGKAYVGVGKAACELTWEYLFPETSMPVAVLLLGRYDVWDYTYTATLPFQYGMRLRASDPVVGMPFWESVFQEFPDYILSEGKLILEYTVSENEKKALSHTFETELDGVRCIAANVVKSSAQFFDSVYSKEYGAMISFGWVGGKWAVSLYSYDGGVDVSTIAQRYGGGGHRGAAGFQCDELPFELK